jgi:hypothetical protein
MGIAKKFELVIWEIYLDSSSSHKDVLLFFSKKMIEDFLFTPKLGFNFLFPF